MKRLLAVVGGLLALSGAADAHAFCRATTCDPTKGDCRIDSAGCLGLGLPLWWESSCITVSVQSDAAPLHQIDFATAKGSVERAFAAWTSVACAPSISVAVKGPTACKTAEYNSDRANANIVMFREDEWPYVGGEDALGITFLSFDPETGALWDADIEVNAVAEPLSVDPGPHDVDLDSLLTHEAGHLLGLAHSRDVAATMIAGYTAGSTSLRSLAPDDIAGICEIYPANRVTSTTSCEPRHGYSDLCAADQPAPPPDTEPDRVTSGGCAVSPRNASPLAAWLVLGAALIGLRRRSRH